MQEFNKEYKFKGIFSGDCEAFCFDVTKKYFKEITGSPPDEDDKSVFHKNRYRVYPNDLFYGTKKPDGECEIEIIVKFKQIQSK